MKKLTLAISLALAAVGAQALTVSGGNFSNAEAITEISQTGTLNLFDSSLGTLTDVELTINGSITTSLTLSHNSPNPQLTSGTTTVNMFFTSTIPALSGAFAPLSLSGDTGFQLINPGVSQTFGPILDADFTVLNAALDAFIASFAAIGGGTFDIGCSTISGLGASGGGGNATAAQETTAGCGASIMYTFAPPTTQVAEPASLALVGLALAAAGIASRRRSV